MAIRITACKGMFWGPLFMETVISRNTGVTCDANYKGL